MILKVELTIAMNREIASNLEEVENILPKRAHNKGSTPSLAGVTTNWNPNEQWDFLKGELTVIERRKIIEKVVEITVTSLF